MELEFGGVFDEEDLLGFGFVEVLGDGHGRGQEDIEEPVAVDTEFFVEVAEGFVESGGEFEGSVE